jgi:hypothetical protein
MGKVAPLVALFSAFLSGCDEGPFGPICADGVSRVSVDEPLEALGGDDATTRFDRAATKPWDCTVTWVAVPSTIGSAEPPAGSSALELTLTRTSDTARYRRYAMTREEKYDSTRCPEDAVFVPCSLGLVSEDGALDEEIECELRLQNQNTLMNLELGVYEFGGTHTVAFVDEIPRDQVELNLAFTPAIDPMQIDGSIVESGTRPGRGSDPLVTTALISCTAL